MLKRCGGFGLVLMAVMGCGQENADTPSKTEGRLSAGNLKPATPEMPRTANGGQQAAEMVDTEQQKQARAKMAEFKSFPFDFDLPDTKGKKTALKNFAGKVVIVDFWATWCPPCKKEIPYFIELYKKYHDAGLEIVGINFEDEEEKEPARLIDEYMKSLHIPYPCLIGDEPMSKRIPGFDSLPTTLFVDRAGKVRMLLDGLSELKELEAFATVLLKEKAGLR